MTIYSWMNQGWHERSTMPRFGSYVKFRQDPTGRAIGGIKLVPLEKNDPEPKDLYLMSERDWSAMNIKREATAYRNLTAFSPQLLALQGKPSPSFVRGVMSRRLSALGQRLARYPGTEVLIAPEYYFSLLFSFEDTVAASGSGANTIAVQRMDTCPISATELAHFQERLEELSKTYPKTLIIPGTVIWTDSALDAAKPKCWNTAFVLYGGALVKSDTGVDRYHKWGTYYEAEWLPRLGWRAGARSEFVFKHNGLLCALQICADNGQGLTVKPDLHFVISKGIVATNHARPGGGMLQADGGKTNRWVQNNGEDQDKTGLKNRDIVLYNA